MAIGDNILRAWVPWLGSTGLRVIDQSAYHRDGTLTGMDPATDWVGHSLRGRSGSSLTFDGVDDWVDFGSNDFSGTDYSVVSWFRILTAGVHFPFSTCSGAGTLGIEILYGTGFNFSQIASRIASLPSLIHDFGSTAAALAGPICFVQTYTDAQPTKTHQIYVNGGNRQSTIFSSNQLASTQNWSWAKRGTTFFAAGGGGSNANGTSQWFEQIVFRGILTDSEVALIYRLGPGGIFQKRKRAYGKSIAVTPTFKNYWLQKSRSLIGGGVR